MFRRLTMRSFMNSVPLLLMVCSIVLLLVLQFLWLTSAYHDARKDFQEETNSLFRNTIFAMHDSLMLQNIEPIKSDSVFRGRRFIIGNSAKNFSSDDTLMDYVKIRETT